MYVITYDQPTTNPYTIPVRLDGKRLGFIRQEKDGSGFFYQNTAKARGETFKTVREVMTSLEAE
jgi:hypothetical protein